jgi:GNAT superfamily N-acetyltransferase
MITVDRSRATGLAVTARPRGQQDDGHLRAVYASTREPELAPLGWSQEQVDGFLTMQYDARERSLPHGADDEVVEVDGAPAGRMIIDASGACLRLVDIALLPEFRSRGVGGELLARLCRTADAQGRDIVLHVLRGNPAADLYRRWGFQPGAHDGPYAVMHRPPAGHQ